MNQIEEIKNWYQLLNDNYKQEMEFTGERIFINKEGNGTFRKILVEHLARYNLASKFVANRKVCDAACGSGYGSEILSLAGASSVDGIDISKEAIEVAKVTFKEDEKITFTVADVVQLPFQNDVFDTFVSFETIEHLGNGYLLIDEAARVLKKGGFFIVSTPNRRITGKGLLFEEQPLNKYHKHEFTGVEFISALTEKFYINMIFGQNFNVPIELHSKISKLDKNLISFCRETYGLCISMNKFSNLEPEYITAVCIKK